MEVSRKKLRRAEIDLYARHPLRIIRALKTGDLDPHGYLILKFVVDEIEAPGRGGEAIYTLEEFARLIGWPHTLEWLRKKLHALRNAGWIDFEEPRPGPQASWIFRLEQAAIDGGKGEFPTDLQLSTPSELETVPNSSHDGETATRVPERVPGPSEFPTAEPSRAEQSVEKRNPLSEGSKEEDHVLGKTTAADENGVDGERLLSEETLAKMDAELRQRARAETRRRHETGRMVNGPLGENERRFLAECQELVDAGDATWIGDELRDEEQT